MPEIVGFPPEHCVESSAQFSPLRGLPRHNASSNEKITDVEATPENRAGRGRFGPAAVPSADGRHPDR